MNKKQFLKAAEAVLKSKNNHKLTAAYDALSYHVILLREEKDPDNIQELKHLIKYDAYLLNDTSLIEVE